MLMKRMVMCYYLSCQANGDNEVSRTLASLKPWVRYEIIARGIRPSTATQPGSGFVPHVVPTKPTYLLDPTKFVPFGFLCPFNSYRVIIIDNAMVDIIQ